MRPHHADRLRLAVDTRSSARTGPPQRASPAAHRFGRGPLATREPVDPSVDRVAGRVRELQLGFVIIGAVVRRIHDDMSEVCGCDATLAVAPRSGDPRTRSYRSGRASQMLQRILCAGYRRALKLPRPGLKDVLRERRPRQMQLAGRRRSFDWPRGPQCIATYVHVVRQFDKEHHAPGC
jgi:hypothetical protein